MAVKLATGATITAQQLWKDNTYLITDFGAINGGDPVKNTVAINKAIEEASKEGGTVVVPEGEFKTYTILLKSRVNLYLEKDSVIRAARTDIRNSYEKQIGEGGNYEEPEVSLYAGLQDHGHSYFANSLFYGADIEDVMIYGEGLIDGSCIDEETGKRQFVLMGGDPFEPDLRSERGHRGEWFGNKAIALLRCKNVVLSGFSLVIGGHFAIIAEGVTNMRLEDLLVDTTRDAIDIDCCQDVTVVNSVFNSLTDDALVLKASYGAGLFMPTKNVLIEDCVVSGYDAGSVYAGLYSRNKLIATDRCGPTARVKLGTESTCGYEQVTIRRVKFDRSRGFALEAVDGADLKDILFTDSEMDNVSSSPIFIRAGERGRFPVTGNSDKELIVAEEGNVRVDNRNWVLPNTDKYQKYPPRRYSPSYLRNKEVTVDGHSYFTIVNQESPAVLNPANLTAENTGNPYYYANANGSERMAKVSDIEISNVTITNADPRYPMLIMGLADSPIENVTIKNVSVSYRGGMKMEHAVEQRQLNTNWEYTQYQTDSSVQALPWLINTFFLKNEGLLPRADWDPENKCWKDDPYNVPEMPNVYPEPSNWGILPAYGLYARHAGNLILENVTMKTMIPDERHAVVLSNVDGVKFEQVYADGITDVAKVVAVTNHYTRPTNKEYILDEPYYTTEVKNLEVSGCGEALGDADIAFVTVNAPAPGTPKDSLYPYPTVPVAENGYTFKTPTEEYPLPLTVHRPFFEAIPKQNAKKGDILSVSIVLKDPASEISEREGSGFIYNEQVKDKDFLVGGVERVCKVTLESNFAGASYREDDKMFVWNTAEMEAGVYEICFAADDGLIKEYGKLIVEITE